MPFAAFNQSAFNQSSVSWPGQMGEKEIHKTQPLPVMLGAAGRLCDWTGGGSFPPQPSPHTPWRARLPPSPWPFPSPWYLSLVLLDTYS